MGPTKSLTVKSRGPFRVAIFQWKKVALGYFDSLIMKVKKQPSIRKTAKALGQNLEDVSFSQGTLHFPPYGCFQKK